MTPKVVGDGEAGWGRRWHHSLMSNAQEEQDVGEMMGSSTRGTSWKQGQQLSISPMPGTVLRAQ